MAILRPQLQDPAATPAFIRRDGPVLTQTLSNAYSTWTAYVTLGEPSSSS